MSAPDDAAKRGPVTWVHVFEHDTLEGAVFHLVDADVPLSRRPRERIELSPDGAAALLMPGPGDGFVRHPATWRDEHGVIVVHDTHGDVRARIIERSPTRLVVTLLTSQPGRTP